MKKLLILFVGLFYTLPKTPKNLESKSNDVFSVFTSTVKELRAVNTEINDEVARREEIIKANEADKAALIGTLATNNNLIEKIDGFLYN